MAQQRDGIRRNQAIGIGAAALIVVVVALIAVVLLNRQPDPVANEEAAPSVAGSASAAPSPTASEAAASVEPAPSATVEQIPGWQEAGAYGGDGVIERVMSLARTDDVMVAVGTHYPVETLPNFGPVSQEGRVWRSTDGRVWDDVTPPSTFADAELTHVYGTADGALIAIGLVAGANETTTTTAWESTDGLAWAQTSLGIPEDWIVERLAHGARGHLALVRSGPEVWEQSIWLSADGRSWEQVHAPTEPGERFTDIGAGDDGFAVLGTYGTVHVFITFAIASADGREWVQSTSPPDGANVIVGQGGDWIAAGTVISGGPALQPPPTQEPVWFSTNGLDWTEIGVLELNPVAQLPDGTVVCTDVVVDLHAAGPWLISKAAAGYGLCSEGRVVTHGTQSISPDGSTWEVLPFPAAATTGETIARGTSITGAIAEGDMLVLVGNTETQAMFWFNEGP